jgi:hypothetical protein
VKPRYSPAAPNHVQALPSPRATTESQTGPAASIICAVWPARLLAVEKCSHCSTFSSCPFFLRRTPTKLDSSQGSTNPADDPISPTSPWCLIDKHALETHRRVDELLRRGERKTFLICFRSFFFRSSCSVVPMHSAETEALEYQEAANGPSLQSNP